eukprot:7895665-Pyramimonas_sp.AAC.1
MLRPSVAWTLRAVSRWLRALTRAAARGPKNARFSWQSWTSIGTSVRCSAAFALRRATLPTLLGQNKFSAMRPTIDFDPHLALAPVAR